jgi:hypothetical protein
VRFDFHPNGRYDDGDKDDPGKSPWDHTGLGYPTFLVSVKVVRQSQVKTET